MKLRLRKKKSDVKSTNETGGKTLVLKTRKASKNKVTEGGEERAKSIKRGEKISRSNEFKSEEGEKGSTDTDGVEKGVVVINQGGGQEGVVMGHSGRGKVKSLFTKERVEEGGGSGTSLTPIASETPPQGGQEGITVSMEKRRALPVFPGGILDTDREIEKLNILPGLVCSTCAIGVECPEFSEGSVCAYNRAFKAFPIRTEEGALGYLRTMAEKMQERTLRAIHSEEVVNGGALNMEVTRQMETSIRLTKDLLELNREYKSMSLTMSKGTEQGTGTSILERLFGGGSTAPVPGAIVTTSTPVGGEDESTKQGG